MLPAASLLKKAGRKLLQNGSAQTIRHFEPRASMRKRERALFVRLVTRGVHVLCALAQRTKMTRRTSSILLLQTLLYEKCSFCPKVFGGCRGLFSKSPLHVLPPTNFNLFTYQILHDLGGDGEAGGGGGKDDAGRRAFTGRERHGRLLGVHHLQVLHAVLAAERAHDLGKRTD